MTPFPELEIVPSGAALGAEIRGVDLREDPPGGVVMQILDAFHEHLVICFRGQRRTSNALPDLFSTRIVNFIGD